MRIVTWNCCHGPYATKAAHALALGGDITVLTECSRPLDADSPQRRWFGVEGRWGITVLATELYRLDPLPQVPDLPHYVIPVQVSGPVNFLLIAVWTWPEPSYVRVLERGFTAYADLMREQPTVVAGDFNSNSFFDRPRSALTHSTIVAQLAEYGLVSSYHHFFGEPQGGETRPTFYFYRKADQPFHIDYCFVPHAWGDRLTNVAVAPFAEGPALSDHRPVTVDVAL